MVFVINDATTTVMTETVAQHSSPDTVLQVATTTLDTLSALLGLSALAESRARPVVIPVFSLEQVSEHCYPHDCWLVLYDRVYDVTRFLRRHPGGADILLENAGRDATSAFHGVGHSEHAADMMRQYQVGVLAAHQCMWSSK